MSGPTPYLEQRPVLVERASAEPVRGVLLEVEAERLRLRVSGRDALALEASEVRAITPFAGPLRPLRTSWPLERDVLPADALADALFAPGAAAYALLSGAAPPELLAGATCLHRGRLSPEQARGAPYLLALAPGSPEATLALGPALAAETCVLLRAAAPLRPLAGLLRGFRRVTDGRTARRVFFRFHEAAHLRAWLPTATAHDVGALFGGVEQEGPAGRVATCPVCETPLGAASACSWCEAVFTGEPGARWLVSALIVPSDGALVRWRPWPAGAGDRPPPRRRGRARLTLTQGQLEALGAAWARRRGEPGLLAAVRAYAEQVHPARCRALGEAALAAAVEDVAARAAGYRVWDAYNVGRLLDVTFLVGAGFDERPWAWTWRELLEDPALEADAKLDALWALAVARDAEQRASAS